MELAQAVANIEYKIATESDNFEAGRTIKMDVNGAWPPLSKLLDALSRKYPYISLTYDDQPNDMVQLKIVNLPTTLP
jgi:hypothetical protein